MCVHLCTQVTYKTTKITLALNFSATQLPLDKEAESQKDHIFSDMKRLRNHTLISCKGYLEDYLKLYPSWVRQIKSINKSQEWGSCDIKGVQVFTYSSKFQTPKRDCYVLAGEFYCPYPPTLRAYLLFSRARKEGEAESW